MTRVVRAAAAVVAFIVMGALAQAVLTALHIRFSAAVLALVVTLALLIVRGRVDAPVERAAHGLLRWLPLFFVPACVGVMQYGALLREQWFGMTATLVLSTVIGIVVGALVVRRFGVSG